MRNRGLPPGSGPAVEPQSLGGAVMGNGTWVGLDVHATSVVAGLQPAQAPNLPAEGPPRSSRYLGSHGGKCGPDTALPHVRDRSSAVEPTALGFGGTTVVAVGLAVGSASTAALTYVPSQVSPAALHALDVISNDCGPRLRLARSRSWPDTGPRSHRRVRFRDGWAGLHLLWQSRSPSRRCCSSRSSHLSSGC